MHVHVLVNLLLLMIMLVIWTIPYVLTTHNRLAYANLTVGSALVLMVVEFGEGGGGWGRVRFLEVLLKQQLSYTSNWCCFSSRKD